MNQTRRVTLNETEYAALLELVGTTFGLALRAKAEAMALRELLVDRNPAIGDNDFRVATIGQIEAIITSFPAGSYLYNLGQQALQAARAGIGTDLADGSDNGSL